MTKHTSSRGDHGPIDAVIAWVDGTDPAHIARRRHYERSANDIGGTNDVRFAFAGEIYIAIASLLKYAPFLRRIYIVTDNQRPPQLDAFLDAGLCTPDTLRVVDHTDILGDVPDALPTFNSLTIEAALWRIPDLSERYIYLNDDFFLRTPATEARFFDGPLPIVRGRRRKFADHTLKGRLRRFFKGTKAPAEASFRRSQDLAAQLAGEDHVWAVDHWPHPMRISVQAAFYQANPDIFRNQVLHRFRSNKQYNPVALANHLERDAPRAPPADVAYIKPKTQRREALRTAEILSGDAPFGCIQSLERIRPEFRHQLVTGLSRRLGDHLPLDISQAVTQDGSLAVRK